MLLEHRGEAKTATELREMIASMDADKNHRLSFVEFCCAYFSKSFEDLNNYVDEDARNAALAEAKIFGEEAAKAEAAIAAANAEKERLAAERAAKIEEESKLTGVAGMRAFFKRQADGQAEAAKSNKETIQEEYERRKALREAKSKMNAAIMSKLTYSICYLYCFLRWLRFCFYKFIIKSIFEYVTLFIYLYLFLRCKFGCSLS